MCVCVSVCLSVCLCVAVETPPAFLVDEADGPVSRQTKTDSLVSDFQPDPIHYPVPNLVTTTRFRP